MAASKTELGVLIFTGIFLAFFFLISGMYEASLKGSTYIANTTDVIDIATINDSLGNWGMFDPIAPVLNIISTFIDLFTFDLGPTFGAVGDPFIFGALRLSTLIGMMITYPLTLAFLWMLVKLLRGN